MRIRDGTRPTMPTERNSYTRDRRHRAVEHELNNVRKGLAIF